jgi:hypothetical protein
MCHWIGFSLIALTAAALVAAMFLAMRRGGSFKH